MAWTAARTWIAGELVTASIGNVHWRDNLQNRYDDGGVLHSYHRRSGIISPTLSSDVNDWNPTGLSTCSVIRVTCTGFQIRGLVAQPNGTRITMFNVGAGAGSIESEHATPAAANRIIVPTSGGQTFVAQASVEMFYDGTSSRWRLHNWYPN